MSVPPRGARNRRSGQRPGWQLLTALLVLAILASSTMVFTNKVELLRLAVILSLWAAVLAAFVSVVYRRQSELDQSRARDMKYVYDLQLDREIAARREYELGVETQLRRQLSRELRTESGEEMAALRAELISLRSHLEALLGTDLGGRTALESDRVTMAPPPQLGRVESSRVTAVITEEILEVAEESVTEETIAEVTVTEVTITEETVVEETILEEVATAPEVSPDVAEVPEPPAVEETAPAESVEAEAPTSSIPTPIIEIPEEPVAATPPPPPPPVEPTWQPPEYRGSHRVPTEPAAGPAMAPPRPPAPPQQPVAPWRPPETQPRRGRHWVPDDARAPQPAAPAEPVLSTQPDATRARHRGEAEEQIEQPADDDQAQHTGGHSVADLMARLQVNGQVGGGGRRRRED